MSIYSLAYVSAIINLSSSSMLLCYSSNCTSG